VCYYFTVNRPLYQSSSLSSFPVYFPAVPDEVNHEDLFRVKYLIYDTVIAYPKFAKPRKITGESDMFDGIQILCQPINTLHNATPYWFVQSF